VASANNDAHVSDVAAQHDAIHVSALAGAVVVDICVCVCVCVCIFIRLCVRTYTYICEC